MKAFELKKSIVKLLEDFAAGRYAVLNPQNRKNDAGNILLMPQVAVYYSEGSFDKSKSSVNSPYHHEPAFRIDIIAAAKASVNLSVLQTPTATAEQLAAALAARGNASVIVDKKMETVISALYDIIMRPEHRKLGTDYITNRWVSTIKKYNPEPVGAIVTEAASITLAAQCGEEVTGEEGTPGSGVDTVLDLGDESKQGVTTFSS